MSVFHKIDKELTKLFESKDESGLVINLTSKSPMYPLAQNELFEHCRNPLTGEYYDGIYLKGEFASIGVLNNNNRIYDKENYLELIELLRYQIHTVGVYGELEHPETYASDASKFSHKLVDIWYDESTDKVMGIIVLLNSRRGRDAQEIVKSGGTIFLSARGGGVEVKNYDGTISAKLRLLVTFDIVSKAGFFTAQQSYLGEVSDENIPELSIYKTATNEYVEYEQITSLNESFQDVAILNQDENQSNSQQEKDIETLQDGDIEAEKEAEKDLQIQTQKTLNESFDLLNNMAVKPKRKGVLFQQPTFDGTYDGVNFEGILHQSDDEFEDFIKDFED